MSCPEDPPFSHDDAFRRFSRTRKAEGGIKAQSRRGKMAQTWWASRWLAVLESFDLGGRLDRGRSYARKGQVLDIQIEKGKATAKVQGSRREPYDVSIRVKEIEPQNWKKLVELFAEKPIYSAKLLAGQMPQHIEDAFSSLGLTLFPSKESDLGTRCSCPDWSNPCKHVAAVYYLLGEEFDRDPFFIFRLRGMDEDELLAMLDKELGGSANLAAATEEDDTDFIEGLESQQSAARISSEHVRFWQAGDIPVELAGDLEVPGTTAPLLRRLGNFPFWRGEQDFWKTMDAVYSSASRSAMIIFGESSGENTKGAIAEKPKKPKNTRL